MKEHPNHYQATIREVLSEAGEVTKIIRTYKNGKLIGVETIAQFNVNP